MAHNSMSSSTNIAKIDPILIRGQLREARNQSRRRSALSSPMNSNESIYQKTVSHTTIVSNNDARRIIKKLKNGLSGQSKASRQELVACDEQKVVDAANSNNIGERKNSQVNPSWLPALNRQPTQKKAGLFGQNVSQTPMRNYPSAQIKHETDSLDITERFSQPWDHLRNKWNFRPPATPSRNEQA